MSSESRAVIPPSDKALKAPAGTVADSTAALLARVKPGSGRFDVLPCVPNPIGKPGQRFQHRPPAVRQLVFHAGRQFGVIVPRHKAIPFKIAKSERQHSLRDVGNTPPECSEPHWRIGGKRKQRDHENRPLVAKPRQHASRSAGRQYRPMGRFDNRPTIDLARHVNLLQRFPLVLFV